MQGPTKSDGPGRQPEPMQTTTSSSPKFIARAAPHADLLIERIARAHERKAEAEGEDAVREAEAELAQALSEWHGTALDRERYPWCMLVPLSQICPFVSVKYDGACGTSLCSHWHQLSSGGGTCARLPIGEAR